MENCRALDSRSGPAGSRASDPKGVHFLNPSDAQSFERRIVRSGPKARTRRQNGLAQPKERQDREDDHDRSDEPDNVVHDDALLRVGIHVMPTVKVSLRSFGQGVLG
jgi:hypothetical protein